jgi:hypothetical protein
MMDGEHGGPPDVALFAARLVVPAGRWKVEMPRRAYITRMLLTKQIYPDNIWARNQEFCNEPGVGDRLHRL